jgi:hypothetical protein
MQETINIVESHISVDIEKLKKIIIDEWQSGELYKSIYNRGHRGKDLFKLILSDLADSADVIEDAIELETQKKLNRPTIRLEWQDTYPKSDVRSIGFEVLNLLAGAWSKSIEELTTDDIPIILEFLDTPPEKSLEAWDKWEKYWANLDYTARRKNYLKVNAV